MDSKTPVDKDVSDVFKLIQPELLTIDELTNILKERSVQDNLLSQDKNDLVKLFKKVAYPFPQREFALNYRGTLIMKQRKKLERKKISTPFASDKKSFTIGTTGGPNTSKESSRENVLNDRLKPPPDMINTEKKRIKLNKTGSSSELDKIVIKRRKTSSESSSDLPSKETNCDDDEQKSKEEMKELKLNEEKKISTAKKISLKRNFTSTTSSSKSGEDASNKSNSECEKKRKPITWP